MAESSDSLKILGAVAPLSVLQLSQFNTTTMRPTIATAAKFSEVKIGESFVCERLPGWYVACWKTTTRTADAQFPEKVGTDQEWSRWYFKAGDDVTRGPVVFA